jgi:C4-dicarboxylate transporter DctM subunit
LILLTPTLAFGQLSAFYDVPAAVEAAITAYTDNVFVVMILIGIFYIIIGTFMESLAQIILFTSVFLPLVTNLGVDPVLFGVFTVITCEIGFLTPPLGGNLNVASRISGITIEQVSVAVLPFIIAYSLGLLILIFAPETSLWLPDFFYGEANY